MPLSLSLALLGTGLAVPVLAGIATHQWLSRRRLARELAVLREQLARNRLELDRARTLARQESDLLDGIVAELRPAGTALARVADALAQENTGAQRQRLLDTLRRSARGIDGTLTTLADRALLQAGQLRLASGPVDLPVLLHELVNARRGAAGAGGIAPRLVVAAFSNQCVLADRERLAQLISLLIDAALAQADARGVTVTLTETVLAPRRIAVRLDLLSHALVRPEQAESLLLLPTLDPVPSALGSQGLALANARQLARLMGGRLGVTLGAQSLQLGLELEAPVADIAEVATVPQPRDDDSAPVPPRVAGMRRVLLVEDNRITQFVTVDSLARMGFEVATAGDGAEALELLGRLDVDLVLTDCDMPGIDGPELARRLRADPRHARLPIIAVTVDDSERMRADCRAAGMDGFLAKPIEPHKLQQLFDSIGGR
ncbi:response regulator [Derxia gummosa]|uniref:Response regulator n=1 Tax=Derxia gummosa DSM 723 TaxID=1121388 RepID=A0A9U5CS28_9BURK|nr:hybrid sensor histidine kinase/response regulator [Derxia gummosa]